MRVKRFEFTAWKKYFNKELGSIIVTWKKIRHQNENYEAIPSNYDPKKLIIIKNMSIWKYKKQKKGRIISCVALYVIIPDGLVNSFIFSDVTELLTYSVTQEFLFGFRKKQRRIFTVKDNESKNTYL